MSISLCVLRFEVSNDLPPPEHLRYCALKPFRRSMSSDSSTQTTDIDVKGAASSASGTTYTTNVKSELPFQEVVRRHRGKRKIHEIVIETHTIETQTGALSLESSKEPSPIHNEIGSEKKNRSTSQINFFSGNPFVEVTKGILHLFKENHMTSLRANVPRSEMLCILAVPAAMTSHDLLQFMAPCGPNISLMRIIRDSTPNQYMALIKFRSQAATDEFYVAYNGTRFNSIEPEVCHLVYVAEVETTKEFNDGCLPLEGHTELPTCPVCLERMDESVDGILTVLCNHSFHGSCLDKWGDTSCPVCRYCQTPEVVADNRCTECHVQESLWICLICGHVGCGRYVEGHAYKHFAETQHTYAMQLGNNRVWDYAGDNYVHRLIQNKADGKLVELNEAPSAEQEEKLDSMQLEYTFLLTSQLESQRLYFEDKVTRIEQESRRQVDNLKERTKEISEKYSEMKEKMESSFRDKLSHDKKIQQLTAKLQKAQKELAEESHMNACLLQNQQEWQTRVKELEGELKKTKEEKEMEIVDLKEQLRDLMFYLEAQQAVQNAPEGLRQEIQDGSVTVDTTGQQATDNPRGGRSSGTRRKKKQ